MQMWSRFINTTGRESCNAPCDLHMDNLNQHTKETLLRMGSLSTPPPLQEAGNLLEWSTAYVLYEKIK